ncbi:MAG: hypothetical protein NZ750_02490 [Anaerolineae bacterium]|nr:hypothetical protein [Anaerolineae bacterium]MDW8173452.1 hypothetical protein [Anaerolineae bacterium]
MSLSSSLRRQRADLNAALTLVIFVCLLGTPLFARQLSASADYSSRVVEAYAMTQGDWAGALTSNPLYSILIFIAQGITGLDWAVTTAALTLVFYVAAALVTYASLRRVLPQRTRRSAWALALLAGLLLIVMPISLSLLLSTRDMLFQWVMLSPHYNPTTQVLRPFVLPLTVIGAGIFASKEASSWRRVGWVALALIVAALLKPSWHIAFLPVLALAGLWAMLRHQPHDGRLLIVGYGGAGVLALGFLWVIAYGGVADDSGLAIMPLHFDGDPLYALPYKLLLSLAFPLAVTLAYPQARRDGPLLLAWATFGVALLQSLLFNETGSRMNHGNFLWGRAISGWVLFVLAVRVFIQQPRVAWWTDERPARRAWLIWGLFALHSATGLLWMMAHYGAKPVMFP